MLRMARPVHRETGERISAWQAVWHSIASATAGILREGPFERSGFNRRLATPAERWEPRSPPGISISQPSGRGRDSRAARTRCKVVSGAAIHRRRDRDISESADASTRGSSRRACCTKRARRSRTSSVVGWFVGRMEFGPRALGARSILGDPRSPRMQSMMNLKIKFRESFPSVCALVLRERSTSSSSSTATRPTCSSSHRCVRDPQSAMTAAATGAVRDRSTERCPVRRFRP